MQQGDISDAADPYLRELDRKSLDKVSANAKMYCKLLGQYRMPFAWAAINIIDLITGNQSNQTSAHTAVITHDSSPVPRDRKDTNTSMSGNRESVSSISSISIYQDKKLTDTPPTRSKRESRSNTMSAQTSRSALGSEDVTDEIINIPQNFSSVTLTLNLFIKQVSYRNPWGGDFTHEPLALFTTPISLYRKVIN